MTSDTKKRVLVRLMAIGLAVIGAVVLTEIFLRLFFPIPYHQFLTYLPDGRIAGRALPNQILINRPGSEVRINSLGFRGEEWDWQPSAGTLRILAFGGSSAFDYLSAQDQTWCHHLEKTLEKELDMPVEVLNLGLPGFDLTNSKVNYMFLGRELHPHVIVVYHTWNDMKKFRNIDRGEPDVFVPPAVNKPAWQLVARNFQLARRLRNWLHQKKLTYIENSYTNLQAEGSNVSEPVGGKAWHWYRKNFSDIVELAKGDGVLPILVSQATIVQSQNLEKEDYRRHFGLDLQGMTAPILVETWEEANELQRQIAEEKGALFINGREMVPPDFEHLFDRVHLTEKGCRVLGEGLAAELLQQPDFVKKAAALR